MLGSVKNFKRFSELDNLMKRLDSFHKEFIDKGVFSFDIISNYDTIEKRLTFQINMEEMRINVYELDDYYFIPSTYLEKQEVILDITKCNDDSYYNETKEKLLKLIKEVEDLRRREYVN